MTARRLRDVRALAPARPAIHNPLVSPSPRIAERYRLLERVGTGGVGMLWAARDERSGLPVAVRILTRGHDDPARVAHFRASARAAARLEHPNIARVLDEGHDDAGPFIVTEWVDGDPLSAWRGAALPWGFVRAVALQLVDALAHVHARGLVHLDLRPGNVLVEPGDEGPRVRVVEVGCARIDDGWSDRPSDARQTLKLLGSLRYMPPETIDSPPWRIGPWSDLYAAGLLIYELLTGDIPHPAESAIALLMQRATAPAPPLPAGVGEPHHAALRHLLERLLERRPGDRPGTAAQVRRTLESLPGAPVWVPPRPKPRFRQSGFELACARAAGFPLLPLAPGPLVGRREPVHRLRAALHDVVAGLGSRLVVLEGPTGVGKSRLADEVMFEAETQGLARAIRVVYAPGAPPGSGLAGAIEDLMRAGATDVEGVRARARALPLLLGIEPDGLDVVLPAILRPEPAAGDGDDTGAPPSLVANAFFEMVRRAARNDAVVLGLDDLHWASGPEGADLVRRLLAEPGLSVLLVATVATDRPGAATLRAALLGETRAEWIPLAPLDEEALRTYVRRRLGLAPDDEVRVVRAAGAHPILLRGIADLLLAGGLVATEAGLRLAPGTLLPEDLRELFGRAAARLPSRGPDTLVPDVVHGLAHARLPLGPRVVAALAALEPGPPWLRALAAAERERLMVRSALGRWRFVHRTVADWLALSGRDGAPRWHRRWIAALERLEGDDRGRLGLERAWHHEALEEPAAAVDALLEAAGRGALPDDRTRQAAERAVKLAENLRNPALLARALRVRATVLRRVGRGDAARCLLDGAEAWHATGAEPGEIARCRLLSAWLTLDAGDVELAVERLDHARVAFERARDGAGLAWVGVAAGAAARARGQHRVARTYGRQAEEAFAALGDAAGLLAARRLRAAAADDAGDLGPAERRHARLQGAADAAGRVVEAVRLRLVRARLALAGHRAHDALALLDEAAPVAEAAGLEDARCWIEAVRPGVLAAAGRHAEARGALRSARAPAPALAASAADTVAAAARHPTAALDPPLRQALADWADRLRRDALPPAN